MTPVVAMVMWGHQLDDVTLSIRNTVNCGNVTAFSSFWETGRTAFSGSGDVMTSWSARVGGGDHVIMVEVDRG